MVERMQQLKVFDKNVEACFAQLKASDLFNQPLMKNEFLGVSSQTDRPTQSGALLNTIKLPRILRQLTDRLPKPNYESSLALKPVAEQNHDVSVENRAHFGAKKQSNQNISAKSPRKSHSDKKNLSDVHQHHITPLMNSTKFAALEMMQNQAMRPTSSRVGNFLPS